MNRNPVSESDLPKSTPIHCDPVILAGKPHVRGTSLTVEFLNGLMAMGWTRDAILEVYQYLTPSEMDAVVGFPELSAKSETASALAQQFAQKVTLAPVLSQAA